MAVLTLAKVQESRNPEARKVDWFGTVTFTGALFLIVFAIIRGNAEGWGSTMIVSLFTGGVVLLIIFLISQFTQKNAMFDVTLFRKPTFSGASIVAFTISSAMFAMFLYLVLYIQTILGLSPLQTGLRFLPFTVVSFFVAVLSGNLVHARSRALPAERRAAADRDRALLMRGITVTSDWTVLLPGFIVAGAGVGLVNPALASTAIGVVPPQRSGMASGINNTFRQVGIATGIAVLGAIFESSLTTTITPKLAGTAAAGQGAEIARAVAAGGAAEGRQRVYPPPSAAARLSDRGDSRARTPVR